MIKTRTYITMFAYNIAENTLRRLLIDEDIPTGEFANIGYDYLLEDFFKLQVSGIKTCGEDIVEATRWESSSVDITTANVTPNNLSWSPYGSVFATLDIKQGFGIWRDMLAFCAGTGLEDNEVALMQVQITVPAYDVDVTDVIAVTDRLHTYSDHIGGMPERAGEDYLENETAVFCGFVDITSVSVDEINNVCSFSVISLERYMDYLPLDNITISPFSSLTDVAADLALGAEWIDGFEHIPNVALRCDWLSRINTPSYGIEPTESKQLLQNNRVGGGNFLHSVLSGSDALQIWQHASLTVPNQFELLGTTVIPLESALAARFSVTSHGVTFEKISEFFSPCLSNLSLPYTDAWDKMPFIPTNDWLPFHSYLYAGHGFAWKVSPFADYRRSPTHGTIAGMAGYDANDGLLLMTYNYNGHIWLLPVVWDYSANDYVTPFIFPEGTCAFEEAPETDELNPYHIFYFNGYDRFVIVSPDRKNAWIYPPTANVGSGADYWESPPERIPLPTVSEITVTARHSSKTVVIFAKEELTGKYKRYCYYFTGGALVEDTSAFGSGYVTGAMDGGMPARVIALKKTATAGAQLTDYEFWYYNNSKQDIVCRDWQLRVKYAYHLGIGQEYVTIGCAGEKLYPDELRILLMPYINESGLSITDHIALSHNGSSPEECIITPLDVLTAGELLDHIAKNYNYYWTVTPKKILRLTAKWQGELRKNQPALLFASGEMDNTVQPLSLTWGVYPHYYDSITFKSATYGIMGEAKKRAFLFPKVFDAGKMWHNITLGKIYAEYLLDFYGKHRRSVTCSLFLWNDFIFNRLKPFGGNSEDYYLVENNIDIGNEISTVRILQRHECDNYLDLVAILSCMALAIEFSKQDFQVTADIGSLVCYCVGCESVFDNTMTYILAMLNNGYFRAGTWNDGLRFETTSDVIFSWLLDRMYDYAAIVTPSYELMPASEHLRAKLESYWACASAAGCIGAD